MFIDDYSFGDDDDESEQEDMWAVHDDDDVNEDEDSEYERWREQDRLEDE